jgi:hypothetical protein
MAYLKQQRSLTDVFFDLMECLVIGMAYLKQQRSLTDVFFDLQLRLQLRLHLDFPTLTIFSLRLLQLRLHLDFPTLTKLYYHVLRMLRTLAVPIAQMPGRERRVYFVQEVN